MEEEEDINIYDQLTAALEETQLLRAQIRDSENKNAEIITSLHQQINELRDYKFQSDIKFSKLKVDNLKLRKEKAGFSKELNKVREQCVNQIGVDQISPDIKTIEKSLKNALESLNVVQKKLTSPINEKAASPASADKGVTNQLAAGDKSVTPNTISKSEVIDVEAEVEKPAAVINNEAVAIDVEATTYVNEPSKETEEPTIYKPQSVHNSPARSCPSKPDNNSADNNSVLPKDLNQAPQVEQVDSSQSINDKSRKSTTSQEQEIHSTYSQDKDQNNIPSNQQADPKRSSSIMEAPTSSPKVISAVTSSPLKNGAGPVTSTPSDLGEVSSSQIADAANPVKRRKKNFEDGQKHCTIRITNIDDNTQKSFYKVKSSVSFYKLMKTVAKKYGKDIGKVRFYDNKECVLIPTMSPLRMSWGAEEEIYFKFVTDDLDEIAGRYINVE